MTKSPNIDNKVMVVMICTILIGFLLIGVNSGTIKLLPNFSEYFNFILNNSPTKNSQINLRSQVQQVVGSDIENSFSGSILSKFSNGDYLIAKEDMTDEQGQKLLLSFPELVELPSSLQKLFYFSVERSGFIYLDSKIRNIGKIDYLVEIVDKSTGKSKWLFNQFEKIHFSDPLLTNIYRTSLKFDLETISDIVKVDDDTANIAGLSDKSEVIVYTVSIASNSLIILSSSQE